MTQQIDFDRLLWLYRDYLDAIEDLKNAPSDVSVSTLQADLVEINDEFQEAFGFEPGEPMLDILAQNAVQANHSLWNTPEMMGAIPGCGCGCGGNSIPDAAWGHVSKYKTQLKKAETAFRDELARRGLITQEQGVTP